MVGLLIWFAVGGFAVTTIAATAAHILTECSWHELEEHCQQKRRPDDFGHIFDLRDQMHFGAVILQGMATAFAICSLTAWLMLTRDSANFGAVQLLGIIVLSGILLIACSSWLPRAIEQTGAVAFLFSTWRWWWAMSLLFWPLLVAGRMVAALFVRASGQEDEVDDEEEAFEDEILAMVSEGEHDGFLESDTRDMIEGVMELDDTTVDDIMTPRSLVSSLDVETSWDEMVEFVVESGRTRIPVYEEKVDNVLGVLYAKDILREVARSDSKRRPLRKLLRKPIVVPGSTLLDEMLSQFLSEHVHMAIVQDEYGGMAGVITIEDVLEEIVGEIRDETDNDETDDISVLNSREADVLGSLHIDRLNEKLGLSLPDDDEFATVAGLIMHGLNEVPRSGHEMTIGNVRFKIKQATRRKIERVRVTVLDDSATS